MRRGFFTLAAVAVASLWSMANATTVTYEYDFSGTQNSITNSGTSLSGGNGMVFTSSPQNGSIFDPSGPANAPLVTIYGETSNAPETGGAGKFSGTLGLFEVTNNQGTPTANTGTGIAPYVPNDNGVALPSLAFQDGITGSNMLLINLSQFTAGSTVSFVIDSGINSEQGSTINVWTGTPTTQPPLGVGNYGAGASSSNSLMNETVSSALITDAHCGTFGHPSCEQVVTIPLFTSPSNLMPAGEWIAIQADCHYLLLQSITVTSPVPEPSFYGFLALGMVGVVFGARKMRARAAAAASEKA